MSQPPGIKRTNRIGRKRRAAGWTLLTLGAVIAAVWLWSGWWAAAWRFGRYGVAIGAGVFDVIACDPPDYPEHYDRGVYSRMLSSPGSLRFYWLEDSRWQGPDTHDYRLVTWSRAPTVQHFAGGTPSPGFARMSCYFWSIPLFVWMPAALLLRSGILVRRRAMANICTKCGYSLAGITPANRCPECGQAEETTNTT